MSTNLAGHLLAMSMAAGMILLTGPAAPAAADPPAETGHGPYVSQGDDPDDRDDADDDDPDDESDDDSDDGAAGAGSAGGDDGSAGPSAPPPALPPGVVAAPPSPPTPAPGAGVAPRPAPPVPASLLVRPRLLSPATGRTTSSRRPVLRWRHEGRGVLIYNIQVFNRGKKVMSVFSRGRAYRVPSGRLAYGRRYIWRVWPYMARGSYTARPLALSWFATPPRPPS